MEAVGFTLETLGKLLVAFVAIMVHHRVLKEHRIDMKVLRSMKRERGVGILGVVLILIGYAVQLPFKF